MSYEDFEKDKPSEDEIVHLTKQLHKIIDSAIEENYFNQEELECVQGQMTDLIRQGVFWLQQENPQRFIYDLKNFLKWLVTFVETRESERG